jgi:hypothetical protein
MLTVVPCHAADSIDATIEQSMAICLSHLDFKPTSIDLYDPKTAEDWEKQFYERARTLHRDGGDAISTLLNMRKNAAPDRVRCIDGILNTWPG